MPSHTAQQFGRHRKAAVSVKEVLLILAILALIALLLFDWLLSQQRLLGRRRRTPCRNNLHEIMLALHNYHDVYHSFPPAYVADEHGWPMHSWRVLILPYLGEKEVYEQYRFYEPWNGPRNRRLADRVPKSFAYNNPVFICPDDHTSVQSLMTSYVAVVGPNTAWPESESVNLFEDFPDGTSNTICIVEVADSGIHWMEPRDLHVNQMAWTINPESGQGVSGEHPGGALASFCDGSVRYLYQDKISPDLLRRLLERNDGEPVDDF